MLKHLVHSHPNKLHTFDDFYRNSSKPITTRSTTNDLNCVSINSISSSPVSPCSPNSNPYTFYNIFSDFKSNPTADILPEEDETEHEEDIKQESNPSTPVFYLEEDHHHHQPPSSQPTHHHSSSPHWPSLILNRFRHTNHHVVMKQNSVNENQMYSTRIRKHDSTDSLTNKHSSHRFRKRAATIDNPSRPLEKKSSVHLNDDFPELSAPTTNPVKKHRSFVSVFHHFHHPNLPSTINTKDSNKSNSTGTLHPETVQSSNEIIRPKLMKQKAIISSDEILSSPVIKSPSTPILPKIASLFHRHHHLSEQNKYRVGNLKARLHHRKNSPPLTNIQTKFECRVSNELIHQIKQFQRQEEEEQQQHDDDNHTDIDYLRCQRSMKPVIMKRVHTWHNTFDLRPIDQCLEY